MTEAQNSGTESSDDALLARIRADWQGPAGLGPLENPPEWVLNRARRLFRQQQAGASRPSLLTRVRARLTIDARAGGLGLALPGVRSVSGIARPASWMLLYRTHDIDVDLLVRPSADGRTVSLRGQALAAQGDHLPPLEGVEIVAFEPARADISAPLAPAELDPATAEFVFDELSHGRYDLLLRLGRREVELVDVQF